MLFDWFYWFNWLDDQTHSKLAVRFCSNPIEQLEEGGGGGGGGEEGTGGGRLRLYYIK